VATPLSAGAARRVVLAAQGFAQPRPVAPVTMRHVQRTIDRLGVVQIDSVNVLTRSQYLPFFSRLGPYDPALLDRARDHRPRRVVEYWAHAASLVPPSTIPLLRWRMARAREEAWGGMRRAEQENPGLAQLILGEVRERGPITAVALEQAIAHDAPRDRIEWGWNWSVVKRLLELLFWAGEVSSAGRNSQFARLYDLPERVLPPGVYNAPTPSDVEAHRGLVSLAARSLGVATAASLVDYYRLPVAEGRAAVRSLVQDGELVPVEIDGWRRPAYLHAEARRPRRVDARALVSPFDSLVWDRRRALDTFGLDYRIEIYVPAPQRRHGYYVLPFLLGDRFVARVDLKADRQAGGGAGVLRVQSAHAEPDAPPHAAAELADELVTLAGWLRLGSVMVARDGMGAGDLAPALADALRQPSTSSGSAS
jgi:uncharacterized protein